MSQGAFSHVPTLGYFSSPGSTDGDVNSQENYWVSEVTSGPRSVSLCCSAPTLRWLPVAFRMERFSQGQSCPLSQGPLALSGGTSHCHGVGRWLWHLPDGNRGYGSTPCAPGAVSPDQGLCRSRRPEEQRRSGVVCSASAAIGRPGSRGRTALLTLQHMANVVASLGSPNQT